MRVHAIETDAPPERVWALIARPEHWGRWSPHVRGAMGLGSPEVVEGASGHVVLRAGVRLPARITEVVPGESWSWWIGGLHVRHSVRPAGTGSRIEHVVEGFSRPWSIAAWAYAPIVGLIARNIARVAERDG